MTVSILVGDVREQLARLRSNFFDCVVTSPPYWGLRDYGIEGQLGLERTLGEHLDVMVAVFREVRRVLKPQGTCWLNYGDSYAASVNGRPAADVVGDDRAFRDKPFSTVGPVYDPAYGTPRGNFRTAGGSSQRDHGGRIVAGGFLKPKDLCMIANRLAIALQDDGWWVRSEIIWAKPNPMPESVYDRPTQAHEKIWLLTKSEDYFYNHAAIREPVTGGANARARAGKNSREAVDRGPVTKKRKLAEPGSGTKNNRSFDQAVTQKVESRNARNVWTIAPKAFREAHFATFPPELARRCILAGTPPVTCGLCGDIPHDCGGLCSIAGRNPGHVLDPFGGAGTVGLVAQQLGLDATLIELSPEYASLAERRIFGPVEPKKAKRRAAE
jgi:DNA modification methylase